MSGKVALLSVQMRGDVTVRYYETKKGTKDFDGTDRGDEVSACVSKYQEPKMRRKIITGDGKVGIWVGG